MRGLIALFESTDTERVLQMIAAFRRAWCLTGAAAGFHVSLSPRDSACEIETIWNHGVPSRGGGRVLMRLITGYADEFRVPLCLSLHPLHFDTRHELAPEADELERKNALYLDRGQLLAWYERLGFEASAGDAHGVLSMVRQPQTA